MTKIQYDHDTFGDRALKWMKGSVSPIEAITMADKILSDYSAQGYILTLRQLYYQFVGQGLTSENTERAYKNLGTLITKARNNGLISWRAIEDRGRSLEGLFSYEEDDQAVLKDIEYRLNLDQWKRQDCYVEVWVEKEALSNVIERACSPWDIPYLPTKGYLSASEAWRAGQRFMDKGNEGKQCIMIHLGDHDPEGLDMTRDNRERLYKYSNFENVEVVRIALNMDQIAKYNPPPNYAKASSSRFNNYVNEYGEECWELDALEPSVIVKLIEQEIEKYIDQDTWDEVSEEQEEKRASLQMLYENWEDVKEYLGDPE